MSDDQDKTITVFPFPVADPGTITHISGSLSQNGAWTITAPGTLTWNGPSPGFIFGTDLCGSDPNLKLKPAIVKQQKVSHGNCEDYNCVTCNEFHPMAELNSPKDAEEFTNFHCYECRNNLK